MPKAKKNRKVVIGVKRKARTIGMFKGRPVYKKADILFAESKGKLKRIVMKSSKISKKSKLSRLPKINKKSLKNKEKKKVQTSWSVFSGKIKAFNAKHKESKIPQEKICAIWKKIKKPLYIVQQ